MDVEAAATGESHNNRVPCRVSAVDDEGRMLYDAVIQVPDDVLHDPLTEITGLTRADIAGGVSFETARSRVKELCGPRTVIVAQEPLNDIAW